MNRDERHAQRIRGEHHHRGCHTSALGEKFGVANKIVTRLNQGALLHRRGHHARKLAVEAAVGCPSQHLDDISCVGDIKTPGNRGRTERDGQQHCLAAGRYQGIAFARQGQAQQSGTFKQQIRIARNHQG